ncbi:MAG: hypothetical protein K2O16_15225 [Lachnospiraceae bacterium]|nr:hypothetical protein [Lachnospiraceae bacterium]
MTKKKVKKIFEYKNWVRMGFVLLFLVTIYLAASILSIKSYHGVNQKDGLYWQPKDSIDVVMMGTSHVHCNINTALLWEVYGIAAYDYSGAEQPLWMTYYYLKEFYKYQSPKAVILDMYAPARFKEDYQYDWMAENVYGMRFSINKLQMLSASVEPARFFEYFPSFAVYHSRYGDLETEDFENFFWDEKEKEAFKGYTPYWDQTPQERPGVSEDKSGGLTEKSEKYLRKIIALTKEKGSDLVLIVAPYVITAEDKQTYNRIVEIAVEEGVTFINYNEYYNEIGLDFNEDFHDESHLNYWGSCKFSDYLGNFLTYNDSIPDRRGQKGYESWDENVRIIYEELKMHGG